METTFNKAFHDSSKKRYNPSYRLQLQPSPHTTATDVTWAQNDYLN